ncbi:MAG: hypothetical protein KTR28_08005 [Micavibrio sp.]|nr:hypothetical protein [Micavibrio sp.]
MVSLKQDFVPESIIDCGHLLDPQDGGERPLYDPKVHKVQGATPELTPVSEVEKGWLLPEAK